MIFSSIFSYFSSRLLNRVLSYIKSLEDPVLLSGISFLNIFNYY